MKLVTYLGSLVQLCCGEGGTLQTNITSMCGECSRCMDHTGFAPAQHCMCFPDLHCSGSRFLCRALSKAGPAFQVLPRSKPLRFRFSGMPQRHRLGWVCILYPSQVRAAQVTRCWQAHSPRWTVRLITSPVPGPRFPGCSARAPRALSQVCHVSSLRS